MESGRKQGENLQPLCCSRSVSILVLMESGRKPVDSTHTYYIDLRVSILVLMESGRKQYPTVHKHRSVFLVSILVLMESGRKHITVVAADYMESGFNPCFNGIWSQTIYNEYEDLYIDEFQSLF